MHENKWVKSLEGKSLAILGGTGTLGKALVRVMVQELPPIKRLVIFSRDEVKQLEMMEEFAGSELCLEYLIGDVRDEARLTEVLEGMDLVIHAAAMKHVVIAEKNPGECHKTNVLGTAHVVNACLTNKVGKVLFISTDKAENPVGVYGKSKLEAEAVFLAANQTANTQFGVVRLGNIVHSRGSVWEVFEKQKKTGTLKVTHEDATRFFISQADAAHFVLGSATAIDTQKIIYPEMKAFRVLDLAKVICPNCRIEITGLRPGDKLHEEMGGRSSEEFVSAVTYTQMR